MIMSFIMGEVGGRGQILTTLGDEYRTIFGVPADHRLTLTRHKDRSAGVEEIEFDEHDAKGTLVARYRWWDRPFANESGWTKDDAQGNPLRQVRV